MGAVEAPPELNRGVFSAFTVVQRINASRIRKTAPSSQPLSVRALKNEVTAYRLLGNHPRIARCFKTGRRHIELEYYPRGALDTFLAAHEASPQQLQEWGAQIIEAVAYIHRHGIIHSDLSLRQYVVDDYLGARLGDFATSGSPGSEGLGYEMASHCLPRDFTLPNTVRSDLFALGSTLYELAKGEPPLKGYCDMEIEDLYEQEDFVAVDDLFCGEVIYGCWIGRFSSAAEAMALYEATVLRNSLWVRVPHEIIEHGTSLLTGYVAPPVLLLGRFMAPMVWLLGRFMAPIGSLLRYTAPVWKSMATFIHRVFYRRP